MYPRPSKLVHLSGYNDTGSKRSLLLFDRATLGILACLLSACAEPGTVSRGLSARTQVAIERWIEQGNHWDFHCKPEAITLIVTPDPRDFCGSGERLLGCLHGNDVVVSSDADDEDYVIEHELRHWLSACTFASVNGAHDDPRVWYPYRGEDIRL